MEAPQQVARDSVDDFLITLSTRETVAGLSRSRACTNNRRVSAKNTPNRRHWSPTEFRDYLQQRSYQEDFVERQLLQVDTSSKQCTPEDHLYKSKRRGMVSEALKRKRCSPARSQTCLREVFETQHMGEHLETGPYGQDEQSPSSAVGQERFLWIAKHPRKILKRSLS